MIVVRTIWSPFRTFFLLLRAILFCELSKPGQNCLLLVRAEDPAASNFQVRYRPSSQVFSLGRRMPDDHPSYLPRLSAWPRIREGSPHTTPLPGCLLSDMHLPPPVHERNHRSAP